MGKCIFMTCDLSEDRGYLGVEHEIRIFDEETSNSAKVDGGEEILKINIEDISSLVVLLCIRNDRFVPLKSVSHIVLLLAALVDFVNAVLQHIRQMPLQ